MVHIGIFVKKKNLLTFDRIGTDDILKHPTLTINNAGKWKKPKVVTALVVVKYNIV